MRSAPWWSLAAWWVLGLGTVAGLVVTWMGYPHAGGLTIAGALAVGGGLRLILPKTLAAGLVVRSKPVDALWYFVGALVVMVGTNAVRWLG